MTEGEMVAFVQLVAVMRAWQQRWFLTRRAVDRARVEDFEGLVDTALLGLTAPEKEPELPLEDAP